MHLRPRAALVLAMAIVSACAPVQGPDQAPPSASGPPSETASVGPTPSPSFIRPTPRPSPTTLAYVVRAGDTLWSIARDFSTTPLSIAYWSRTAHPSLDPDSPAFRPDRIEVGWVLSLIPGQVIDGSDLPEPTPTVPPKATASATARATKAPTPSPAPKPTGASGEPSIKVGHGSRSSAKVALTFDMGGRLDPALDIMAWLVDHEVHATIFPTGKAGTTTDVGRRVLTVAAGRSDLFTLGNHSWSHPDFRDLTEEQIREELERTDAALAATAGRSPKPWFRPPYGGVDARVLGVVGRAGYRYTVMWDVDTIDWRPISDGGPTASGMVDKVVDRATGGSIVLMHLGGYETLDALPGIVAGLRAKGLTPVTLAELFPTS
jgi:peptidoglycan/xylan/chitin deacetylase (PgdA/CDA1 family)